MRLGLDTNSNTTSFLPFIKATPIVDPVSGEAGVPDFICRYLGRVTPTEVAGIRAAGLAFVSIVELTTSATLADPDTARAYFNFDQGRADGVFGIAEARKIGQPSGTPIYFCVDYDDGRWRPPTSNRENVVDYFNGVNTAMANADFPYAVGVYGCGCILDECRDRSVASHLWQANAAGWCGNAARSPGANIVQFSMPMAFPGTTLSVDLNCSTGDNEGGW